jgi:hypothetical protein
MRFAAPVAEAASRFRDHLRAVAADLAAAPTVDARVMGERNRQRAGA